MTVTIHAVDLDKALIAFSKRPLSQLIETLPGGRVAAVCVGRELDLFRPAGESRKHRRTLFEAIVEDQARASAWDVPRDRLDTVSTLLEIDGLDEDGDTAYPGLDEPNDRADSGAGKLILWSEDPAIAAAAQTRMAKALDAANKLVDVEHVKDLLDAFAPLLAAAAAGDGVSLVASF